MDNQSLSRSSSMSSITNEINERMFDEPVAARHVDLDINNVTQDQIGVAARQAVRVTANQLIRSAQLRNISCDDLVSTIRNLASTQQGNDRHLLELRANEVHNLFYPAELRMKSERCSFLINELKNNRMLKVVFLNELNKVIDIPEEESEMLYLSDDMAMVANRINQLIREQVKEPIELLKSRGQLDR